MKHKRDFAALEKRRLKGAKLLARGVSKSEVARQLGVTRQTVAAWEQRLAEGGKDALKRGELGRPRQLDAAQERELGKLLMTGALAAGYPTKSYFTFDCTLVYVFAPILHPYIERLIGTVRRECLDQTLFWNRVNRAYRVVTHTHYR